MKPPVFDPAWPAEVQEIYRNDMREMWDPALEPHSYSSYQNQLRLYREIAASPMPRRILDVGCAQATLAMLLAEDGHDVTALDIRQPFLDYARTRYERGNLELRRANLMDRPDLGTFDLVFANQIIEHLVRPVEFISCLARYLTEQGRLVLTTPNQRYVRSGLPSFTALGDVTRFLDREFSAGGADHFFAYTAEELTTCVAQAGLRVKSAFFYESPWISGHMKVRYLHGAVPRSMLRLADRVTLRLGGPRLGYQLCVIAAASDVDRRPGVGITGPR